jgi:hypothetical protein
LSFGLAPRAIPGAAQNKPAWPMVLRNARRVGELTAFRISRSETQRKTGLTGFIRLLLNPI